MGKVWLASFSMGDTPLDPGSPPAPSSPLILLVTEAALSCLPCFCSRSLLNEEERELFVDVDRDCAPDERTDN